MCKKLCAFFMVLSLTMGLFACDDESVVNAYIEPVQKEYTVGPEGGVVYVKFESNGMNKAYVENCDWIILDNLMASTKSDLPTSVQTVQFTVFSNEGSEPRTGVVKGVCFGKEAVVKIIQAGKK
ncbi:hypothetical protein LJB97_02040 [Parabacteroides sp. OttesenSCG-928-O15]|nr:hypothetical protein [Parabacteroides sp. OttesenSCG-928-O15]